MKTKWLEESMKYNGRQLRSLYSYMNHGVLGDVILAWRGACDVSAEFMVDGEDELAGASIAGGDMIHIIVEHFGESLSFAVATQRMIAAITKDLLVSMSSDSEKVSKLRRDGDDIYWKDKKFSISVATVSPVSALLHFAVNVRNEGTPVSTCSLEDFGVEPVSFAKELIVQIKKELESVVEATQKVHWVK